MDYVLTRYRIKGVEDFRKAFKKHFSNRDSVKEAMLKTNISIESLFIEETSNNEGFFFVFKRVIDHREVRKAVENPKHPADQSAVDFIDKYLSERIDLSADETFDFLLR